MILSVPVCAWSRETGSAVPSHDSLLDLVLTRGIPPVSRHRVSPGLIGSRNCVPMAFSAEGPRPKDSRPVLVVVVFFTLTDRASTIPSNIRGCQSGTWSAGQKKTNFCPRSRLSFWSREEGSALPPRVGSPILHAQAESGAYSPSYRFPRRCCSSCLPLPLVRPVWLVGLAKVAPSTPSSALLVDQITRAASH